MALKRKDKERLVEDLTARLKEHAAAAVFSFTTLTVADSARIRRELRKSRGVLRVVPKRLLARVADAVGLPREVVEDMEGSAAVAWSQDAAAPAKVAHTFVDAHEGARLEVGLLQGAVLDANELERLARLPGLQELRAQLVGTLANPLREMAGVLSATLRGLPGVLRALAEKKSANA